MIQRAPRFSPPPESGSTSTIRWRWGRAFLAPHAPRAKREWLTRAQVAASFLGQTFKDGTRPGYPSAAAAGSLKLRPSVEENIAVARFASLLGPVRGEESHRAIGAQAMRYAARGGRRRTARCPTPASVPGAGPSGGPLLRPGRSSLPMFTPNDLVGPGRPTGPGPAPCAPARGRQSRERENSRNLDIARPRPAIYESRRPLARRPRSAPQSRRMTQCIQSAKAS